MSFALFAFVFAVSAALSHASAALNNLVDRQATTSHAPVSGCQPECSAYVWESHWTWMKQSITATVTHATIVYIVNDEGQTRTSTIFNELPEGVTPPPTNAAGTHTAAATVETEFGKYTTLTLAYPTEIDVPAPSYDWRGVLPTVNAQDQFTCSTRSGLATEVGVELIGYTASISTDAASLTGTRTRDPGGLLYTLASYACQVGAGLSNPPAGNADDAAVQYCATNWANCPVGAQETIQFLTETSTTRERATSRSPTSSTLPTTSAEPTRPPSTTAQSTSRGALPVQEPETDSTTAAASSSRAANPRPTNTPASVPDDEGSNEPLQGETFPPIVSTTTVIRTSTGTGGTSVLTVATEVTISPASIRTPEATNTGSNFVVVPKPSTDADASSGPSSTPIGDVIAGGLGISSSGSSTGSSNSPSTQPFPGETSRYSIPSSVLVVVLAAVAVLEARLTQADTLKKTVDAIKDLVQDCNFDCNDSGIALQAMDNSHVALVSMMLRSEQFEPYRCDRNVALGINLNSLTKVLRAAQSSDVLTLKAEDSPDVVNLIFESPSADRISEYDIKLMDIDQEHLGIPETEYSATIKLPSAEFQRITRDLGAISESVAIECTKEGVKFSSQGDIGNGAVTLRSHNDVEKPDDSVEIHLTEPVALTFSLKYLSNFCKATGLSKQVKLCLSNEVPLLVEYDLANSSYLRFYLAPKIGDEE